MRHGIGGGPTRARRERAKGWDTIDWWVLSQVSPGKSGGMRNRDSIDPTVSPGYRTWDWDGQRRRDKTPVLETSAYEVNGVDTMECKRGSYQRGHAFVRLEIHTCSNTSEIERV